MTAVKFICYEASSKVNFCFLRRGAVWNSLHHHVGLCGKCSADDTDEPTEAPGVTEANVAI